MEVLAGVVLGACVFVALWFLFPFALRRLSERRLRRLCRSRRAIVLSYDDGPGPALTPRLLDLLGARKVAATFFVLGRSAEANTGLVARAVRERHEVGSHTFGHANAWKVGPLRAARDLEQGIGAVRRLGGDARLFRPPYGKMTLATLAGCLLRGQRLGWWTIDSKDARDSGARRPVGDILAEIRAQGGGVVLAHDFDKAGTPAEATSHADYVIDLTERVIGLAEADGFRLMRLGDVMQGARR
ncbi:MAG: polysaccharide deacetylase family protein [Jhaorihella sp.]